MHRHLFPHDDWVDEHLPPLIAAVLALLFLVQVLRWAW